MRERTCPRHGYGLAGKGCPVCSQELALKEREVKALEDQSYEAFKANQLEAQRQSIKRD
mgnify:CR=1 FL=1